MRIKSAAQHFFSQIPDAKIQRSIFPRTHGHKTTFNSGYLIPVLIDEALPGDTFSCKMKALVRMSTPLKPLMDNLYLDTFFFAVPMRLIWDHWEKFCGAQDNPNDSTIFTMPQMSAPAVTGVQSGELSDYFGIPIGVPGLTFNSHFHRAYNLIWNTWFKSEDLQDNVVVDKDDGSDTYSDYVLLRRTKRHDYFTSCLPWPQKVDPAVTIPLGTTAPVKSNNTAIWVHTANPSDRYLSSLESTQNIITNSAWGGGDTNTIYWGKATDASFTGLYTDLNAATAATINSLRQAFQLQKMFERDARGGTRYVEVIRSHFNVSDAGGDARFQRPEYLGGGSTPFIMNPVIQNSASGASGTTTKMGDMAATATTLSSHGFYKSFTEHCVIMGLVCVRADLNYQQGLNRMFSRQYRYDFYWPSLANIGEQAVLKKEIFANNDSHDDEVFGYQERYAEYRYKPNLITGLFRSTASGTLDIWHLAQEFENCPGLDDTFIEENPPVSRCMAVANAPEFLFDSVFDYKCARPMPTYSVPGLIDHF